jgi:hypothetical protein
VSNQCQTERRRRFVFVVPQTNFLEGNQGKWPLRDSNPTQESNETPEITRHHAGEAEGESSRLATAGDRSKLLASSHGAASVDDLERAIASITRAIGAASDDEIADLVSERRDMRGKLAELQRAAAGNVIALDALRRGGR